MVLSEVVRSDGKRVLADNFWMSKTRATIDDPWVHRINLFDVDTTGEYTLYYVSPDNVNQAPVLDAIEYNQAPVLNPIEIYELTQISLTAMASDPENAPLTLTAKNLPVGATFVDNGDGTGVFNWTPAAGQAGSYDIAFTVSDGELTDEQRVTINVFAAGDNDRDFLDDAWETANFGDLAQNGTGDSDNDGITNVEEFLNGTDPNNTAPGTPVIANPADGMEIDSFTPTLSVQNSTDAQGDILTYTFEVYSDADMTTLVDSATDLAEGAGQTSWAVIATLDDNTQYWWQVTAHDQELSSVPAIGSFFVNSANDAPSFVSDAIVTGDVDVSYAYDVLTSDPDINDTLTITALKKPDWLTLTDNGDGTAIISGKPASSDARNHGVVLEVADQDGANAVQFFIVNVGNVTVEIDAPHNESHGMTCTACHEHPVYKSHTEQDLDDTNHNVLCLDCHGAASSNPDKGEAPVAALHSSLNMAGGEGWATQCISCHDPHFQGQLDWAETDSTNMYLVTGSSGFNITYDPLDGPNGSTTVEILDFTAQPGWEDPAQWSSKSGVGRGLIFVPNKDTVYDAYEIIEADSTYIKVVGEAAAAPVTSFGIIYGQLLNAWVPTPSDVRKVKFYEPDSGFVDQSATATPQGNCQVCHKNTTVWRQDGTGTGHYAERKCTDCHSMAHGFGYDSALSDAMIASPAAGSTVTTTDVELAVTNSGLSGTVNYTFELDTVSTFDSANWVTSGEIVEQEGGKTSWQATGLVEDTWYYWRAMSDNGMEQSAWVEGSFFVNTMNNVPPAPVLKSPVANVQVDSLVPALEVMPVFDSDGDSITYTFEIYDDSAMTQSAVATGTTGSTTWVVDAALQNLTWYYWRARAEDPLAAASAWSATGVFITDTDGIDNAPEITMLEPSGDVTTSANELTLTWEDTDPDSAATIALYYDTDDSGADGTLIVGGLAEEADGTADDSYLWDISTLADGTYYVYAVINDGAASATSYSAGAVTIDHTEPGVAATPAGGTYGPPQTVVLASDETGDIYFTTNDSDPVANFVPYTAPVAVDLDLNLRFYAVDTAGNQSGVITETYVITDTDNDGLPDSWEITYFGDLAQVGTDDPDADGVVNSDEYANGTDPTLHNDIDNDGITREVDNCPSTANADQADCDTDGMGDVCDPISPCSIDYTGDGNPDSNIYLVRIVGTTAGMTEDYFGFSFMPPPDYYSLDRQGRSDATFWLDSTCQNVTEPELACESVYLRDEFQTAPDGNADLMTCPACTITIDIPGTLICTDIPLP